MMDFQDEQVTESKNKLNIFKLTEEHSFENISPIHSDREINCLKSCVQNQIGRRKKVVRKNVYSKDKMDIYKEDFFER